MTPTEKKSKSKPDLKPIEKRFARAFKNYIQSHDPPITQVKIAELAGIKPAALSNILNGNRGSDEDLRRKLMQVAGIKQEYSEFVGHSSTVASNIKNSTVIQNSNTQSITDLTEREKRLLELVRTVCPPTMEREFINKLEEIERLIKGDEQS